ncbi:trehalose-phosphatase [Noviherbaspirillum sp. ST9]|uniref:trehalose-phosphatase n=1 Tax=Noviherbaspirillum sp. ST9 TaxID=3401606 RepID=UPI003B587D12
MSMEPLFSAAGRQRLAEIARDRLLCAFDFDGTLAPIMQRPEQVRLPAPVRERLLRLSALAPVAIITGRALDDIHGLLDFTPAFVVGNHGMEGVPGWEARAARHERDCGAWKTQLARCLASAPHAEGISIEDKRYSLSVHYRAAPDQERAAAFVDEMCAGLEPRPRLVAGKCIVSLVGEDAWHKGNALEALMEMTGATSAIYAGDDVTDEDVFRIKRADLLSVRVERSVASAADFFVPQAQDMERLLDDLIAHLDAGGSRNWLLAEASLQH